MNGRRRRPPVAEETEGEAPFTEEQKQLFARQLEESRIHPEDVVTWEEAREEMLANLRMGI